MDVTEERATVVDTSLAAGSKLVTNTGDAPVVVTKDPLVEFADGPEVAAGGELVVSVGMGERLFAICDEGDEGEVEVEDFSGGMTPGQLARLEALENA